MIFYGWILTENFTHVYKSQIVLNLCSYISCFSEPCVYLLGRHFNIFPTDFWVICWRWRFGTEKEWQAHCTTQAGGLSPTSSSQQAQVSAQTSSLRALSYRSLNTSKDRACTTSLSDQTHCLHREGGFNFILSVALLFQLPLLVSQPFAVHHR